MTYLFATLYCTLCAYLFIVSWKALHHMRRNTSHMRRCAFLCIGFGSTLPIFEFLSGMAPLYSASFIVVGVSMLFFIGSRERMKYAPSNNSTQTH